MASFMNSFSTLKYRLHTAKFCFTSSSVDKQCKPANSSQDWPCRQLASVENTALIKQDMVGIGRKSCTIFRVKDELSAAA